MRLAVSGGGTGGHIYPAIAVVKEMKRLIPSSRCLYLGTSGGMEKSIVHREGIPFAPVRSSGVAGKSVTVAVKGLFNAALGVTDAVGHLRTFRPDIVLGTGGYVSGPVIMAAFILGIPSAIQEQNAVPGSTNLLLSRVAARTFAAFEYSVKHFPVKSRIMVTGNPVRQDIFGMDRRQAREYFGIPQDKPVVLVLGGSRGAETLVNAGLALAKEGLCGASMLLVTGRAYFERAASCLNAVSEDGIDGKRAGNIIIRPYVHNMAAAYGAADLVIGRAGGMTVSEIAALGLPSIIVPSPNVAGNHQEYNARALAESSAAVVVREDQDTVGRIVRETLGLLKDESRLAAMSEAARKMGRPQASSDICRELVRIARLG